MAMFKPVRVSSSNLLDSVPKIEGQFIVDEESQTLYFDKSNSERVAVGSNAAGANVTYWNGEAGDGVDIEDVISQALLADYYTKEEIDVQIGDIETLMAEI